MQRPAPARTATTLLRRHGDFAVIQVVHIIRAEEAENRPDAAWWYAVLDALWAMTAHEAGERSIH